MINENYSNAERLKSQNDFHKFEYGQYNTLFIGLIAILIAIFIPITLSLRLLSLQFLALVLLLILIEGWYIFIRQLSSKTLNKLEKNSKELERLYIKILGM